MIKLSLHLQRDSQYEGNRSKWDRIFDTKKRGEIATKLVLDEVVTPFSTLSLCYRPLYGFL